MGRPPKKRAREDENLSHLGLSGSEVWADSDSSQFTSLGVDIPVVPESLPFCAPVYSSPFNHNHSWQLDHGKFLDPVPATTGPWPDFSSVSAAASNSFSLPPGLPQLQSPPTSPSDPDSSEAQSKTARAVIRCQACPKKFATGLQNVMFTGTLLTVMGDAWLRVSKADAAELGKQAAPSSYVYTINQNSSNPAESWKEWLRQTVRSGVAGVPSDPAGAVQCSGAPSLLSLIEEMEARQRRWHQSHPLPQSERLNVSPEVLAKPYDPQKEQDLLCLRVVKSAREVIAKFEFEPHEFPDGVGI
ncbi:hypothetical protein EYZ11_012753 [Aspergillus tanneri]|uniref:Uncharacterized protein n=1 Tax=Aspergillus tanneri TaxID=1220188 RepID=A0A4S3IZY5_9EURO|nr:hypothetical protein EYZ11_012753 [Aspergillus tanneri]